MHYEQVEMLVQKALHRCLKNPALWDLTAREMQCLVPEKNRNQAPTPDPTPHVMVLTTQRVLVEQNMQLMRIVKLLVHYNELQDQRLKLLEHSVYGYEESKAQLDESGK